MKDHGLFGVSEKFAAVRVQDAGECEGESWRHVRACERGCRSEGEFRFDAIGYGEPGHSFGLEKKVK